MALKNKLSIFFLFLLLWSCTKQTTAPETKAELSVQSQQKTDLFKLSELESASDYLTLLTFARIDKELKRTKTDQILSCDPQDDSTLNAWMMTLKSLIDEQDTEETESKPFEKIPLNQATEKYKWFCNSPLHKYLEENSN